MTIAGFRLSWLKRRWWVLVASIIGVSLVSLVIQRPEATTYTSEALLIVRSGATENTPGNANEANRLAVTYSQLIPQDSQVLAAVSETLGVELDDAADSISASNDANTSILRVGYTADNSQTAINGARAVANALIGASPAATNFRGVGLSRLPDTSTRNQGSSSGLPVGIMLGLLLGLVLITALERNNGRIDSIEELERELNCPVTSLQGLSSGAIVGLLQRWQSLARQTRPGQSSFNVAVVPGQQGQRAITQEVAVVFAATANMSTEEAATRSNLRLALHAAGVPSTWEVGERAVQDSDLSVLAVSQGTKIKELRRCVEALNDFGSKPSWALFASTPVVRRARRHHGIGEPVISLVEAPAPAVNR